MTRALLVGFTLSLTAWAQDTTTTTPPAKKPAGVDKRHAYQQKRIGEGLENGSLTAGEAKRLETKEQKLNKEEAAMRSADGGKLTAADKAKLEVGDKIVKFEGIQNPSWDQIEPREAMSAGQPLHIQIQRGMRLFDEVITPVAVDKDQRGQIGWEPAYSNSLSAIEPGMPADKAGLKIGDEIKSLDNVIVRSNSAVIAFLQNNKEKPVTVTYVRDGKELTATVTPVLTPVGNDKKYRMGVALQPPVHYDKLPFGQAFAAALKFNRDNSMLIFEMLHKLVQRPANIKQMSSPIGMAPILGDQVRRGSWYGLLFLTSLISLNLGIFNLLPIPILDGGLILLLFIEGTIRRDIKREVKERIYQVAFVFIVLFAVVVIFNDVAKTNLGHILKMSSLLRIFHLA